MLNIASRDIRLCLEERIVCYSNRAQLTQNFLNSTTLSLTRLDAAQELSIGTETGNICWTALCFGKSSFETFNLISTNANVSLHALSSGKCLCNRLGGATNRAIR
jgi:hypothetical protein